MFTLREVVEKNCSMSSVDFQKSEYWPIFKSALIDGTYHSAFEKYSVCKYKNYMITYTLDPSKNPDITEEEVLNIEQIVRQQGLRQALCITNYTFVREYTKAGMPHWHAVLTTTRTLKKSMFNKYTKKYGNIDISLTKHSTQDFALDYINKEGTPETVI